MTDNPIDLPKKIVIDASIAVKWFAEEKDSPQAREVFEKIHKGQILALVPDLIYYEVINALWKSKKQDRPRISRALEELFTSPLEITVLDSNIAEISVEYMLKYNLTFYYAVYVGLSKFFNASLLSANPKDHDKVEEIKVIG